MFSKRWLLLILFTCPIFGGDGAMNAVKETAAAAIAEQAENIGTVSTRIWELAELALQEHKSAELLAETMETGGFKVERGVAGMPTAWVASYGSGKPVIAFLAEYDALPGLSQKASPQLEAREPGAPGHGCGHSLFGPGSVSAGLAVKAAMEQHGLKGTVRVYGTPAEEHGIGKVFMVRNGLFDDVDLCLSWHPYNENRVNVQPAKALRSFEVTFYGRSAHAAGAPWNGVSALDAVEAFTTGVNLLREHMPETGRMHYVITDGGGAPNVIPAQAKVWMFTRGKDWPEQEKIFNHVATIVKAADMMAWGEEYGKPETGFKAADLDLYSGLYDYNINRQAALLVQANLALAGAPDFTENEQSFGRELQKSFGLQQVGFHTEVTPLDFDRAPQPGGSTDVANISWVAPTVGFGVANWPRGVPAHSWASTAATGHSAGIKAMHQAAKVMAFSAIDVFMNPARLKPIKQEFKDSVADFNYAPAVGPDDQPRLPSHMSKGN